MNASITPTVKIAVLVVFAIIFATTLIALSVQVPRDDGYESYGERPDQQTKKYSETFTVQKGGNLRLDTDIGDVTITGGDVTSVQVTVDVKGDERDVEDFVVKFNQNDQGVEVRGRNRENNGWHFEWRDFDVHYVVVVPREFNIKIETSGGDIEVTDIKGMIGGGTSGGDMTITGVDGDVKLETSGGDIILKNITGTVITETSGGDIDGTTLTGDVKVETSGGDIELREVDGKTVASTSGGNVRIELMDNKGVDASTSGGNIVIRFPETIAADVYAESHSGNVSCDFPIQGSIEDGTLEGKINGGGVRVSAETSGGNISIRKR